MSAFTQSTTPSNFDPTYGQAREAAHRDYARLAYIHDLFWQFDDRGQLFIGCCCDDKPYTTWTELTKHITEAIRAERGPVKSK